jgi:hypothetical protein
MNEQVDLASKVIIFNNNITSANRLLLLSLLWEQDSVNVWQDTALCDSDISEQLVQLLIISDSKLQVTGDDSRLLVVSSSVSGQLEDLSAEILQDGGEVDWGSGTNTLGIVSLSQETMDSTDWELKACSR